MNMFGFKKEHATQPIKRQNKMIKKSDNDIYIPNQPDSDLRRNDSEHMSDSQKNRKKVSRMNPSTISVPETVSEYHEIN